MVASVNTSPELYGLVLAGGESRRMGRDKGALELDGEPLAVRAHRLLRGVVSDVRVSVRAAQATRAPYSALPLTLDTGELPGPAAGLVAAWAERPCVALLVLAVDMARVDAALLERLIAARDPAALATAFAHADGTPEPLCTIWEPAARGLMTAPAAGAGISLRRILEHGHARLIPAPDPARLVSVNAPEDLDGGHPDARRSRDA